MEKDFETGLHLESTEDADTAARNQDIMLNLVEVKENPGGLNRAQFNKLILLIITLFVCIFLYIIYSDISNKIPRGFDTKADPIQTLRSDRNHIYIRKNGNDYKLSPAADFVISARVVAIKKYEKDTSSDIMPYDIGLVWGELARKKYDKYMSHHHGERVLNTLYYNNCPLSFDYVKDHSSNTHVIPSNDSIMKALESMKVNQFVTLEGFLVNAEGNVDGRRVLWKTSLSRTDMGDNSCEVMYIKKATVDNEIFE